MNAPSHTSLKLLDSVPALLWQAGTDAKWNFFNKYWLHYRGRTLEQELGHGWVNGVHPGDRNTFVKAYLDHFDAGEPFAMEVRLRHRDGSYRWVVIHGEPVLTTEGNFSGYLGYGHDVTEQKRYFEDLHQSRQRFQTLANMSPSGIFRINPDGVCEFVSDRWCDISGIPREKAMGLGWLDALHPDDRSSTEEALDDCLSEIEHLDLECRYQFDDGETSWVLMQLRPEFDEHGILDGFFGSITDLSPEGSRQDDAATLNCGNSLGIFTEGVAHEFNNLLTPILLNLGVVKAALDESDAAPDLLERIEEAETATLRAHGITQKLFKFNGETERPAKEPPFLKGILEEAIHTTTSRTTIESDLAIDEDLWPIDIDREMFSEALENLLRQAILSIQHGGAVRVTAMNLEDSAYPGLGEVSGRHIAINIEELAAASHHEDFFPQFDLLDVAGDESEAPALEVAETIIHRHGGHLIVESEIGAPSSYTIVLPAAEVKEEIAAPVPEPPAPEAFPVQGNGARLLVMDDEDLVRSSMKAVLTALGYEVVTARDGSQALELYREAAEKGEPIDLALVDLSIPGGMGGKETLTELKAIDPEAIAVVFSGHSHDPVMANFEAYGFSGALAKPFHPAELQSLLKTVAMK